MVKGVRGKKGSEAVRQAAIPTSTPRQQIPKSAPTTIAVAKPQAEPAPAPQAPPAPAPRMDTVRPMGFGAPVTTTLSSVGTSRAINLDWMNGSPVAVLVLGSSSGTTATIQYTLDDIMQTASSLVQWISDPNFTAATSNTSVAYSYTQPLAAIRLNSSTASGLSPLTLKVTQASWL